jgi:hypothetical protein
MDTLLLIILAIIGPVIAGLFGILHILMEQRNKQEKDSNAPKKPYPNRTGNLQAKKPQRDLTPDPNPSGKTNPGDHFDFDDVRTVGSFIVSGTDKMTIDVYKGHGGNVAIFAKIDGKPVTVIGVEAFECKQLTSVTIGENVTRIEARAFYNNKLTSVIIPNSVTYIGNEAFAANHLTRVTFNRSGVRIEDDTFDGNLADVYKSRGAGTYTRPDASSETWVKGDFICTGTDAITITGYTGSEKRVSIPAVIGGKPITSIGDNAFISKQLTSLVIPKGVTSIGYSAFSGNALTSVVIPDGVTSIGPSAFAGSVLTSVVIPDSVKSIGINAFLDNPLTSITIGADVSLGSDVFKVNYVSTGFEDNYNTGGRLAGTYTRPYNNRNVWLRH